MKNITLIIAVVIVLASCNKEVSNTLKVGEITEIKLREEANNTQYGLSLRVVSIDDTRCPIGVICIWEGNASVQLHLKTKEDEYNFTLDTNRFHPNFNNEVTIEGFNYQLIDVLPYPVVDKKQSKKTIKVLIDNKIIN